MRLAEAVKVNQEIIPSLLLAITVLERLESKEGSAPGKCVNNVFILTEDIEGGTDVGFGKEIGEDAGSVICGLFALEDRASRFKKLDILGQSRKNP